MWQIYVVLSAVTAAFFSYRQGRKEGVSAGIVTVIADLHSKGIVAIYQDYPAGEMVVGRYDENEWQETSKLGEDEDE